jgi:hypothetical protein
MLRRTKKQVYSFVFTGAHAKTCAMQNPVAFYTPCAMMAVWNHGIATDRSGWLSWRSCAPNWNTIRPASPAEGILATCRLSDEARTFAQAALHMQYPLLSPAEIEAMYFEQRVTWTRQRQRLSIHGCSAL